MLQLNEVERNGSNTREIALSSTATSLLSSVHTLLRKEKAKIERAKFVTNPRSPWSIHFETYRCPSRVVRVFKPNRCSWFHLAPLKIPDRRTSEAFSGVGEGKDREMDTSVPWCLYTRDEQSTATRGARTLNIFTPPSGRNSSN